MVSEILRIDFALDSIRHVLHERDDRLIVTELSTREINDETPGSLGCSDFKDCVLRNRSFLALLYKASLPFFILQ